jgi:hypothetical protein
VTVEVRIGVQYAARELVVETSESNDVVEKLVSDAVSGESGVLVLTDTKGKRTIVPAAKIAYVEIGTNTMGTVGFRS